MTDTLAAERLCRLQQTADVILDRINRHLELTDAGELTPQAFKHYSGTLKDIRDIHLQRIDEEVSSAITVELGQELEDYSG